jgi:hypothetical protein
MDLKGYGSSVGGAASVLPGIVGGVTFAKDLEGNTSYGFNIGIGEGASVMAGGTSTGVSCFNCGTSESQRLPGSPPSQPPEPNQAPPQSVPDEVITPATIFHPQAEGVPGCKCE